MANQEVARFESRLDNLFGQVALANYEAEVQAHWARYLCVLCSGYLETSVRAILSAYVRPRSSEPIQRFVAKELKSLQNPKMQRIIDLVSSFSPEWGKTLTDKTLGQLKDAVDSIVNNRNAIAHGEPDQISFVRIKEYYKAAKEVVRLLDELCNPT